MPLHVNAETLQLPQTGQTTSYAAGDDGALQKGVAWPNPRFTDNGNLTVTDNLTGLMWEKNAYMGGTVRWQQALDYTQVKNSNNHLGYSDWRLPNRNELKSLVNLQQSSPADWLMLQGFTDVIAGSYWTSSTSIDQPQFAFTVNMSKGGLEVIYKGYSLYVWHVRGGQSGVLTLPKTGQWNCWDTGGHYVSCRGTEDGAVQSGTAWPTPRFTDNSNANPADLTITDNLTGLIWTKDGKPAAPAKTWQQALDYIQSLNSSNYLGHSDWRLPNRNEMESLSHLQYSSTAYQLYQQGFVGIAGWFYWTSSTCSYDTSRAWTGVRQIYGNHYHAAARYSQKSSQRLLS